MWVRACLVAVCFMAWLAGLGSAIAAQAVSASEFPIYLYTSPLTDKMLKDSGQSYDLALGRWQRYLRKYGKASREIGRQDLTTGALPPGLLILASAQVLAPDERAAITAFTDRGGSLLATWATGNYDDVGHASGYGFLDTLLKVRVSGPYNSDAELMLMPFGDGPLTWALPAGRRMSIGKRTDQVLRAHADNVAAIFMDWIRSMDDAGGNIAISFHEAPTHRGAYFAFSELAWGYQAPADMTALLDGVVAWLRREPRVFKSAWPNGQVAAHLIEMDTEDKFFTAPRLADELERIGVKGSFYCLTSEALKYPGIVQDLAARGHEVAYHADVHIGFKGENAAEQETRILRMKQQLEGILKDAAHPPTGFRAPTEGYDGTTEVLLRKHGILHHAADPSSTQDRIPFFSMAEPGLGADEALVVLPRTQFDDVNFKRMQYRESRVVETMTHDLDLALRSGALSLLSVHSQNFVDGGLMREPVSRYVDLVARQKGRLWVARGDQIAAWWRLRERVKVRQTKSEKGLRLQVSVRGEDPVDGLTVFAVLPAKNVPPSVEKLSQSAPVFQIRTIDAFRSAIVFDRLVAGEYEYLLQFGGR